MRVNEPQFFQWMSRDYEDQKCAEILFSDLGEKENPLMGEDLNIKHKCRACTAQQAT